MPRRPNRSVPVVVVPGWNGSGDGHWQTWLEGELRAAGRETYRPEVADWDAPDLAGWRDALRATLAPLPAEGFDVVAHSLGAVLWLHHTHEPVGPRPARVALVSPPSPGLDYAEIADFLPAPLDIDAVRAAAEGTVLVGGNDDPHCPEGIAAAYGVPLKMATTVVEGGGHFNTESGYGEWPAMLSWCNRDNLAFY